MDESWAECESTAALNLEPHREPHPDLHDLSLSFLRPGALPDDDSFNFWPTSQDSAVDLNQPNDRFINPDTGIRPFFDGRTSRGEVCDFFPPFDQFIDGRSPHGDGEPQQQFLTVTPGSTGGFGAYLPGAHTGTASNTAYVVEEADFRYGEPTHRAANPEFGRGVDSYPPIPWMDLQNVEVAFGFDQTSGVKAFASTEHPNTDDVPTQSSGSNVGNGMAQYQYQTSPIPVTETTAQPEHGCFMPGCTFTSRAEFEIGLHIRSAHLELLTCCQCQQRFPAMTALGKHASETGHASFVCAMENCEKAFSRYDVLERHLRAHRSDTRRFPCPHCRRHRGADGFKRKDHLTQHLRNYHHIGVDSTRGYARSCPHEDCPDWRPVEVSRWFGVRVTDGRNHAFKKSSDYITHMRKVHKESEFPCTERDCDRVGPKGYFRKRDVLKHKLRAHDIQIE